MRQVNRDELLYMLASAIRDFSPMLYRDLMSPQIERRDRGRVLAAGILADKALGRFEILSPNELPGVMGEAAYSRPIARMMGEDPKLIPYTGG